MKMSLHTNIMSNSAHRNLSLASGGLGVSMQRLSSGLRVNGGKDDAAGLAISQRMMGQNRGLSVAVHNTNNGISLAQTAEGALEKMGDMLQRMRELAVQSANVTNSDNDRQALQTEVLQLRSELDRVAASSTFNGQKLLNGTLVSGLYQVGANAGDLVSMMLIGDMRSQQLGQVRFREVQVLRQVEEVFAYSLAVDAGSLRFRIGLHKVVELDALEPASSVQQRLQQVQAAINAKTQETGVVALVQGNDRKGYQIQLHSTSTELLTMEGFTIEVTGVGRKFELPVMDTAWATNVDGNIQTLIDFLQANPFLAASNTSAEVNPWLAMGVDHLTSAQAQHEWRQAIQSYEGFLQERIFFDPVQGRWTLSAQDQTSLIEVLQGLQLTLRTLVHQQVRAHAPLANKQWMESLSVNMDAMANAQDVFGFLGAFQSAFIKINNEALLRPDPALQAQAMQVFLNTLSVLTPTQTQPEIQQLMLSTTLVDFDQVRNDNLSLAAASAQQTRNLSQLDISTQLGAWTGLRQLDRALDQVNGMRSQLGAWQNRLGKIVENIDVMNESVYAAHGRIVDADFAQETASLSRAQILQQAGTAMVAQANQLPQQVLSLLQ